MGTVGEGAKSVSTKGTGEESGREVALGEVVDSLIDGEDSLSDEEDSLSDEEDSLSDEEDSLRDEEDSSSEEGTRLAEPAKDCQSG